MVSANLCGPWGLGGEEESFTTGTQKTTEETQSLAIFQGQSEEILKKDSAVARFILVFPARVVSCSSLQTIFPDGTERCKSSARLNA